jgi:DNA-binding winged helix-turn-helix (wHTH) protein/TolB-like protein/Flp pilus assembly protein TadD
MSKQPRHFYEFGPFRLDETERLLLRDGETVAITPKAFDMLVVLVQNSGHLLVKEELMKALWSDGFVEEANLSYNVFTLRKALGEGNGGQAYIETIPKRGYRFVANVREVLDEGAADLLVEERAETGLVGQQEEEERRGDGETRRRGEISDIAVSSRHRVSRSPFKALAAFALLAVTLALGSLWLMNRPKVPASDSLVKSIAVLPFKPVVADSRNEYLELGMADTLINKLSSLRGIIVRPISAVRKYSTLNQDALAAGRELGVDAVLDASIQWDGESKIRVAARLLSVRDGSTIWTDKCDKQCSSIFAVQDSIAEQLVGTLALKLTGQESQLVAKRYTESADAYHSYIIGLYYFAKWREEGYEKSIEYFKQAIDKDPNYALAYAGLAEAYGLKAVRGASPAAEVWPKSRVLALRAWEIDPSLAEAHNALGEVSLLYDWDWPTAEKEFKLAIELNPSYGMPHRLYAMCLQMAGRFDEAIAQRKRAIEIDPLDVITNSEAAQTFYLARQYDQAIQQAQMVIEMNPKFADAHGSLGQAYLEERMYDQAIAEFQNAEGLAELQKGDSRPGVSANLGYAYAVSGKTGEAREVLGELKRLSKQRYVSPYSLAVVFTGLGDKDQAFESLKKACEERSNPVRNVNVDPKLDSLRTDPRYPELLRCIGLAP